MLKGLLASGITLGAAAVFPEALVFPFLAVVLGLVSGVYPGMAMADTREGYPRVEWVFAAAIVSLGMAGLWTSPLFLVGAWLLRGLWDLTHKFTALGDPVPDEFPGACFTFDLAMAAFITYAWGAGG